ncbi:uncharacterized protein B0H18DRAFT_1087347 [Fomitopsis serialis]|uniref:uncharacterized protein n=1 Tax=Fomitopsis serialis TaxID=139415 RepID=UPI002007DF4C|nr:uncharacterized protein B0H18DRAFT_1087347 [Neoantrodia serialis]KAH9916197.1 hypothetical protein B0H18DRAFT_1087347 [Neoantrodia serialis]
MGVAGLWDILRPAGETRSLTHLSVVDGFEANPDGVRGFRVGIDASIWFFHAAYGREGENPELRTLFFKCTKLMSSPFLPLFVFDARKRISGKNHWMIQGMQEIINAFGFEWRMAPGEAEAELAYLNRLGVIDAVYTDDVDTFLFGGKMVVRNASITLSGNRAHSLKNSAGREDGNHVATYTSHAILTHPSIQLTHGGLILIGVLRGGDYHSGLAGCAPCLPARLAEEVRAELRSNARGILGKKYAALSKKIPEDFPDIDVLLSYTNPIDWEKEPDLGKMPAEIIIKRFRTVLWPAAVLRILRRVALLETSHFSSLQLNSPKRAGGDDSDSEDEDDEDKLIVKIHSSRQHASTDGVLEYRLEVAPAHLIRLSESGVRGLRTALATGLDDDSDLPEDDDSDGDGKGKKRVPKPPPDPQSHLRIWLPACMVRVAQPDLVDEFEGIQEMRAAKKAGKAKGTNAVGTKAKAGKKVPVLVLEEEEESSDGSVSPTPKKARPKASTAKQKLAVVATIPKQASTVKEFFVVGKPTHTSGKPSKTKSSTAKVSALFAEEPTTSKRIVSKPSGPAPAFDTDTESDLARSAASSSRLPSLTNTSRPSSTGLSLSDSSSERQTFVPAPFPMSFDKDEVRDDRPTSTGLIRADSVGILRPYAKRLSSRSQSPVERHIDKANRDGPLQKSPRKSQKQTSPRRQGKTRPTSPVSVMSSNRPISPSPIRQPPSRVATKTSSSSPQRDHLFDVDSEPEGPRQPKIAPLFLARTKVSTTSNVSAKSTSARARHKFSTQVLVDPHDIIDLT